jgi:hypothetical protein
MALVAVAPNSGGGDRLPVLKYDARAGRFFLMDRVENAGVWETVQTELPIATATFAMDFGSVEVGWFLFPKGAAPMMVTVPYGQPLPPQPSAVGTTTDERTGKERPNNFKMGFRCKVAGKALAGTVNGTVRELAANAGVTIEGLNDLHTAFESAPEAAAGKIPVVKVAQVIPTKSGQSTNYKPVFQIVAWADRPTDMLGPRTVPAPGVTAAPPPVAAPPASGGSTGAALDDSIPFSAEWR